MQKLTVYGLPIAPASLMEDLRGASFCVSYGTRTRLGKQLDQAIDCVGQDGILLVDNGAYSAWQAGVDTMSDEYIDGFEAWACAILDRCPQAVVVIPDVIDGSVEKNWDLCTRMYAWDSDRAMPVWHLHEPISFLRHMLDSGFNFLAFGSSGQYAQTGTPEWHARVREAFAAIDAWEKEDGGVRPRIHMMRAQQFAHLYPFDSTDSTNLCRNHNRQRRKSGESVKSFAARIDSKIQASAGPAARHQNMRPLLEHLDRVDLLQKYFLMDRGFSEEGALEFMRDCAAFKRGEISIDVDEFDEECDLDIAA